MYGTIEALPALGVAWLTHIFHIRIKARPTLIYAFIILPEEFALLASSRPRPVTSDTHRVTLLADHRTCQRIRLLRVGDAIIEIVITTRGIDKHTLHHVSVIVKHNLRAFQATIFTKIVFRAITSLEAV